MSWDPSLTQLRGVLAELYSTEAEVRRIVADAGLAGRPIDYHGSAVNIWQAVLEEAVKLALVDVVVIAALLEYPTNPGILEWCAKYGSAYDALVPSPAKAAAPSGEPVFSPDPYEYDVFISYRHRQPVLGWMQNHFYPMLSERLPHHCLIDGHEPRVFIDWDIEAGTSWPAQLRHVLKRSRCMVSIWSPDYFQSEWCTIEHKSMRARERALGLCTDRNPRGLIFPVKFSDGESFPDDCKNRQWIDVEPWNSRFAAFANTVKIVELEDQVKQVCAQLAPIIRAAPAWRDWPVAKTGAVSSRRSSFPRYL